MPDLAYAAGAIGTDEVLFATADGIGHVLLNRPRAMNSLTTVMCAAVAEQLAAWADDDAVQVVLLRGAGERGLCAGGDVKTLRQALIDDPASRAPMEFFTTEYAMNRLIGDYPKPYVAFMDGAVMGGGLGISAHGSDRLVTERSKIAMPETIIGFFPDVGMLHLLANAPGEFGTMLALTGITIGAADAIACGLADAVVDDPEAYARARVAGDAPETSRPAPELCGAVWIDDCFTGDSTVEILERLKTHTDEAAHETAALIEARSPLAVAVTLRALRCAASLDLPGVLDQDIRLAEKFTTNPDFLEGVRCTLVDRGQIPQWRHTSLADVSEAEVDAFFA